MNVGVIGFPVAEVDAVAVARAVEEHGFESWFCPEHTHIPVDRRSPFPATADGRLPEVYLRNLDPFVALGAAAAATSSLVLGTGVCLAAQREPAALAGAVTTLDRLAGGRFVLGVGAGWNVEEMRNHGVPPERRWGVVRERVRTHREVWHGPVLVGGMGPRALERVRDYGDGWLPAVDDELAPLLRRIDGSVPVTLAYGPLRAAEPGELTALALAGVTRCLLALPSDDTFRHLERLAAFAAAELGTLRRPSSRPTAAG